MKNPKNKSFLIAIGAITLGILLGRLLIFLIAII